MPNFAINGFGRIGRTSFRVWWQFYRDQGELTAINTSGSMEIEDWAHLLKYDTNYGIFSEPVNVERLKKVEETSDEDSLLGYLHIGDKKIAVTAQRDPAKIPWGNYGVEGVIESTGKFLTPEKAGLHLQSGAKRVVLSAPAKGEGIPTGVVGVNEINADIMSNASCTTNCVAPVTAVMQANFGIVKATMSTIHAYTDDQNIQDNSHRDMRRARTAGQNIIPTSTGAAKAVTETIPELKGLFDGIAFRVPVSVGSISDMVFVTKRPTSVEEVNEVFRKAASEPHWQNILAVTDEQIVSSDIVGRRESSIVDLSMTQVIEGDLVKVVSWYDNEWGYCNRLVEQVVR